MTDEEMVKEYRKSLRQMTGSLYHKQLEKIKLESMSTTDLVDMLRERDKRIEELEAQIEKMKTELHHRLVSPSHDDSDCLDKIIGLDRLWQFGQKF